MAPQDNPPPNLLRVTFRSQAHDFVITPELNVEKLARQVAARTGAAYDTLKLLQKGSGGKSAIVPSKCPNALVSSFGLGAGSALLAVGSTNNEVQAVRAAKELPGLPSFEHELKTLMRRQKRGDIGSTLPSGPFTFQSFQAWQPPPGVHPPPSHALQLMHRLAADPGIVAVMAGRRWTVGLLAEMPPEGLVGVSQVCVLGYNTNAGQSIHLRLRTDDLRGFRSYLRIRETLVHELTHNVHSDHDASFKALNSQLLREVGRHDERARSARTLAALGGGGGVTVFEGAAEGWVDEDDVMAVTGRSSGRTLRQLAGGGAGAATPDSAPPRQAASLAALQRLGGGVPLPGATTAGGTSQAGETGEGQQQQHQEEGEEEEVPEEEEDPGTRAAEAALRLLGGLPTDLSAGQLFAATAAPPAPDAAQQALAAPSSPLAAALLPPAPGSDVAMVSAAGDAADAAVPGVGPASAASPAAVRPGLSEVVPLPQPLPAEAQQRQQPEEQRQQQQQQQQHHGAHGGGLEEGAEVDALLAGMDPDDPMAQRYRRMVSALAKVTSDGAPPQDVREALSTLQTILGNAASGQQPDRYRRLRLANPEFARRVGRHPGALELLLAAGFAEEADVGSSNNGGGGGGQGHGKVLRLRRDDPALLWLGQAAVQRALARLTGGGP